MRNEAGIRGVVQLLSLAAGLSLVSVASASGPARMYSDDHLQRSHTYILMDRAYQAGAQAATPGRRVSPSTHTTAPVGADRAPGGGGGWAPRAAEATAYPYTERADVRPYTESADVRPRTELGGQDLSRFDAAASHDTSGTKSQSLIEPLGSQDLSKLHAVPNYYLINKGEWIDVALERWADEEGWAVNWVPNKSWIAPETSYITGQDIVEATTKLIHYWREEGKQVRVTIYRGNDYIKVESDEIEYENER